MKNLLFRTMLSALALFFVVGTAVNAETINTCGPNAVTAVYDYNNFENAGSFTKIFDPVNNKETHVYTNARVTGHQSTDNSGFIKENVTILNANGIVSETRDIQNGKVQKFNYCGQITGAYSYIDKNGNGKFDEGEAKYAAKVEYRDDGSYTITWTGVFKDPDSGAEQTGTKSVENYAADGRIMSVTNNELKDGKIVEGGTTKFNYDNGGKGNNLLSEETYTNGKLTESSTYAAGRKVSTTKYTEQGSYTAAVYNYEGNKLVSVTNYKLENAETKATSVESTTFFDKFGRVSTVKDAMGRVVSKNFYNDSNKTTSVTLDGKTVKVVAGGLAKSESYTYYGEGDFKKTDTTIYIGGNASLPYVKATTGDDYIKFLNTMNKQQVWTCYGDPTVTGKISLNSDGTISFTVTDKAQYDKMIAGLNEAIKTNGQWTSATSKKQGARLLQLKAAVEKMWASNGSVTMKVGAINLDKLKAAMGGKDVNFTGHATSVSAGKISDAALMQAIVNRDGKSATLTWDYWSIDAKGNVWCFANALS